MTRRFVFACFVLSGASSLVYELVWMRQLELTLGVTTGAVSALLAVFMLGLGAGARVFGPLADRTPAPLRVYGLLEARIGLYALGLPWLQDMLGPAYLAAAGPAFELPLVLLTLRVAYAAALLLAPTVLMGATLPVLVRFVVDEKKRGGEQRLGWDLGTLYGANLVGAFAGTVLTGFVLIRVLGLRGAATAAATVNLLIGVSAVLWNASAFRPTPGPQEPSPPASPEADALPREDLPRGAAWLAVVLSGFVSIGYQVLWTRILTFSFSSTVSRSRSFSPRFWSASRWGAASSPCSTAGWTVRGSWPGRWRSVA